MRSDQMIHRQRILTLTSAAALSLALGQAVAQTEAAAPPAAAAPAAAPAPATKAPESAAPAVETAAPAAAASAPAPTASTGADAMREKMEQRHAEAMAERDKRYAELRQHAAEVGIELPETPPWEQAGMPEMPAMPEGMPAGMMPRPAQMTDEERQAMREKRWEAMRARAAERGMELPETPPWEAAEQRRKEMQERFEQYRATIDAMSDEQKEAIKAIFGSARAPMERPVMPRYGMPCGQYGADCPQGYGSGMGPYRGPGMEPGMGPGMPGMGLGMDPGMMPEAPPQPEPPAPAASVPPVN
jgi:hypothetical protein